MTQILTDKNCKVIIQEFSELHITSACVDIGRKDCIVYVLKHVIVPCIEIYLITMQEYHKLDVGSSPLNFIEYRYLSLDEIVKLIQ